MSDDRPLCRTCGRPFDQGSRGRPRKDCEYCSPPRRNRGRLRVVPDPLPPPPADASPPAEPGTDPAGGEADPGPAPDSSVLAAGGLAGLVRRELGEAFSTHPAAETLTALAVGLALDLEYNPTTQFDGRVKATVTRQLVATIGALTSIAESGGAEDDLFAETGQAPLVIAPPA